MALDPNVILQGTRQPNFDPLGEVTRGAQAVGIFAKLRQQQEEAPIRQAILQNQSNLLAQQVATGAAEAQEATRKRDLKGLGSSYLQVQGDIAAGNFNSAADQLQAIYDQKIAAGQTPEDMSAHAQAIETLRSNDAEAIKDLKALGQGAIDAAVAEGLLEDPAAAKVKTTPAAVREFESLTGLLGSDNPQVRKAAEIKLGLTPDAGDRLKQLQDRKANILKQQELILKQQSERRQQQKLSATVEKALLESQDAAINSSKSATEFDILANQVEEFRLAGGVVSSTSELFKRLLGAQDDVTELRRRFNQVRLSEGLKNLPPGPATDRDVVEAFKGVPPENAPGSQIASFLRGAAKMARFDAAYNQFKSDFISDNSNTKGINKEWRKKVRSDVLGRDITIAEIYAEGVLHGMNIEDIKAELGVSE